MPKRLTTEEFIERAKKVHGEKYDYSKVKYINTDTKVCIICPEHGEFWQTPDNHLQGRGCYICGKEKVGILNSSNVIDFIIKAKEIHGNKYDYSKVNYKNNRTKVRIMCPEHGEFQQTPAGHLSGRGCPICRYISSGNKQTSNTKQFIEKAHEVHGNKYDYSKVEYVKNHIKVCITCPEHGEWWQTPSGHLSGRGCPVCRNNTISKKRTSNTEKFIEKAILVHGDKYDYTKVEYVNQFTPITIICPEHGEFQQIPKIHLRHGICPLCNESKLEREVRVLLEENYIEFETQFTFPDLGIQKCDFYLPKQNIIIECQGLQHFEKIQHFGGKEEFEKVKERDKRKYEILKNNNYNVIYYSHCNYNTFLNETLITDKKELLSLIK